MKRLLAGMIALTLTAGATAAVAQSEAPLIVRLQGANPEAGKSAGKMCQACHTFGKDEAYRVGPNLFGIVGSPVAVQPGYAYSQAILELGASGVSWSYDRLDAFLASPRVMLPGTSMAFIGIEDPGRRADLIVYLRTLSDDPEPLPSPQNAGPRR